MSPLAMRLLEGNVLPQAGHFFEMLPRGDPNPLKTGWKYYISPAGQWVKVTRGEHCQALAEMEEEGYDVDGWLRVVSEGNVLYFEGTANRRQMKELKDAAIMNGKALIDDDRKEWHPLPDGFARNW